ncbi:MAG: RNA polymerase sigma factor [Flavonifractor plautii]
MVGGAGAVAPPAAGGPSALEELMDRDMGFACGLAGSVLRGRPRDAEEVVSDAFLALWEHAGQVEPRQAPPLAGPGGAQQGPQPPAGAGR